MPGSGTFPGKRPLHQDLDQQGDSWPLESMALCCVGFLEERDLHKEGTQKDGDKVRK